MNKEITFISQMDKPWETIGCGIASLMMLLHFHCERKKIVPSYRKLGLELRVTKTPKQKNYKWYPADSGKGVYVDDIVSWLASRDFGFIASYNNVWSSEPAPRSQQTARSMLRLLPQSPMMVGMFGEKEWGYDSGHWIVLENLNQDNLVYLDPQFKNSRRRNMPTEKFFKEWDGSAVAIQDTY